MDGEEIARGAVPGAEISDWTWESFSCQWTYWWIHSEIFQVILTN